MYNDARKRILETYKQTAEIYDKCVSERFGDAKFGIESLTRLLLRDMVLKDNTKILDLACGTGLSTFQLVDWLNGKGQFYGVDFSPYMIKRAEKNAEKINYKINFQVGDAESLKYPDNFFDAVISNMSFQMFPDKLKALKEIYRILKPGGKTGLLYGANDHLKELVTLCQDYGVTHPELSEYKKAVSDVSWMHINLEDTQRLFWEAGFRRPLIYGYHRIMYVNPKTFWGTNPYPALWESHIPVEIREEVCTEIINVMKDRSIKRGFKINWYTIQSYGSKPT